MNETHTKPDAEFDRDAKTDRWLYPIWPSIIQLGKSLDAVLIFKSTAKKKEEESN